MPFPQGEDDPYALDASVLLIELHWMEPNPVHVTGDMLP